MVEGLVSSIPVRHQEADLFLRRRYEFITRAEAEPVIRAAVGGLLRDAGFREEARFKWLRQSQADAWNVVDFYMTKGAGFRARWGLSFPFVPHIVGQDVRWHRTAKAARLDLWILDPALEDASPPVFDLCFGLRGLKAQSKKLAPKIEKAVVSSLSLAQGFRDLPRAFEQQEIAWSRWGFNTFAQHPIAYAFVLARLGRREEGARKLAAVVESESYHEHARNRLRQLFDALPELGSG